ncbi:uncharacterized protein LOC115014805 isoform X4 [Cottoperca gobio]|uniref:Uncharacterized protein LOC115014805 isoform X4 n=1 Tax=Cottoperca gobio TaxID=56716 RepID=A0A6J2QJX3_COTGO|nr:uncharacterized protein LOC115014805 isoform X4 [Cottoperca gobio]
MDVTEENMTPKEMREKIVELEHGLNQQRDLNAKINNWLDVADDDIAMLRTENGLLSKQVKALEKSNSGTQQIEAEPCRSLLADNLNAKRCSENKIQKLEKESTVVKEHNKTLTEEKNLQSKQSEKTEEEYSNIIEYLRLTNWELREQLEDRQDEASFAMVNDLMGKNEGMPSPCLSFAEELKLLASSAEMKTIMSDSTDLRHEESEAEEPLNPQSLTVDRQTKRCAGTLETAIQRAGLFLLSVFILTVLAFVTSGSCTGNFFSINTLWSGARLMLQPYCSVHYGALPPI